MTATTNSPDRTGLDLARIRADFPILSRTVNDHPLVYLDNAASAQKPQCVIDAVSAFYERHSANIHRGVHRLSVEATDLYETARQTMATFINAERVEEIIFVRGATEAVNLVAQAFGRPQFQAGDEIILSTMEHHSNIVPWQMLRDQVGVELRIVPIDDLGAFDMDAYEALFTDRTRLVATVHVSNALGTINPVKRITEIAHARGVPVLLDGAQVTPHVPVDVQDIGCDFYAVSGHKMFGPTGIGVLHGRFDRLNAMEPYQGGGDMILSVTFEKTTYNKVPAKFEAGTPNVAGAIGLGAAASYLMDLGMDRIAAAEHDVFEYGVERLATVPGLRFIGEAPERASVLSFVLDGVHPHDIGTILDQMGIAIRTGHHCAQPVMKRFGVPATARASLAFYNTRAEIDALTDGLRRVMEVFG